MTTNYAKRASLLVVFCLLAMVNRVEASLQTQLDGDSLEDIQLVTTIASSVQITGHPAATGDERSSSGQANTDDLEAQRRAQVLRLPGLAEHSSSSSAATTSPTDGGSPAPPCLSQASVLPGELEVGTVVAMKAMIPPDPPPSGLLKPPRMRRI